MPIGARSLVRGTSFAGPDCCAAAAFCRCRDLIMSSKFWVSACVCQGTPVGSASTRSAKTVVRAGGDASFHFLLRPATEPGKEKKPKPNRQDLANRWMSTLPRLLAANRRRASYACNWRISLRRRHWPIGKINQTPGLIGPCIAREKLEKSPAHGCLRPMLVRIAHGDGNRPITVHSMLTGPSRGYGGHRGQATAWRTKRSGA